jgi:hypothetical protein
MRRAGDKLCQALGGVTTELKYVALKHVFT